MKRRPPTSLALALAAITILPGISARSESPNLQVNFPLGHTDRVTGGAFLSPRLVATCSEDATIIVWDVDTGCPLRRIFLPDQCFEMNHLERSDTLEANCGTPRRGCRQVRVNPFTGEVGEVKGDVPYSAGPFPESQPSPLIEKQLKLRGDASVTVLEGNRILVGYDDGKAELWSTATGRPVVVQKFRSHIIPTSSVAAGGGWLASWIFMANSKSHHLRFWNPQTLRFVPAEKNDATSLISGVFVGGGAYFVSCEHSRYDWRWDLVVREVESGRVISTASTPKGLPSILATTPGDDRIIQTQYGNTGPGVFVWSLRNGELKRTHDFPGLSTNHAVLDPRRQRLYSKKFVVAEEGLFDVHNLATGRREDIVGAGLPTIFGTVVGMRFFPKEDILLTSTFHRADGYCAITELGRNHTQIINFPGIHSAFPRHHGRQLLLGGTAGNLFISLLDRNAGTTLSRWEYPQSNYFREHYSAAYGWTNKKDAVALSEDQKTVYVVEPTGAIGILRISDRDEFEEAGHFVPLTEDDWAIVSPKGNYASSPGGAEKMAFSKGQRTFPFEQFDLVFNRPDLVIESLDAPAELVSDLRKALDERRLKYSSQTNAKTIATSGDVTLSIHNREEIGIATNRSQIHPVFEVEGLRQADAKLVLHTNGVRQSPLPVPTGSPAVTADVPLTRGVNRIEAVAILPDGSQTLPAILRVYHDSGTSVPDLFLLSIGVSDYAHDSLDLSVAAKDAQDVVRFFKGQEGPSFGEVHHRLILDAEATKETIQSAAEFFSEAEPEDTAIVFLAGHGMLESGSFDYFFGTTDIDPDDVSLRGLPYAGIEELFSRCRSGNRLILMDTCFAGEVETFDIAESESLSERIGESVSVRAFALTEAPSRRKDSMARLRRELFSDLRKSSGANVITASGGMEFVFAEENQGLGNGLFTHCVLRGIATGDCDRDGDGKVTVSELSHHLKTSLTELSGGAQQPSFREINRYSDFGIARCRAFPKLDAWDLLSEMLRLTQWNGGEDDYAALFSPSCDYFGTLKSRSEIAEEERSYHEKYDERELQLISEPKVTPLGEAAYSVTYRIQIFLQNTREGGNTYAARFDVPDLIEQELRIRVDFEDREWLISSIEVLAGEKKPNPHYKPSG